MLLSCKSLELEIGRKISSIWKTSYNGVRWEHVTVDKKQEKRENRKQVKKARVEAGKHDLSSMEYIEELDNEDEKDELVEE